MICRISPKYNFTYLIKFRQVLFEIIRAMATNLDFFKSNRSIFIMQKITKNSPFDFYDCYPLEILAEEKNADC